MEKSKTFLAVPPGETLKELIKDKGLTRNELADKLGESYSFVDELINGTVVLSENIALNLEAISGIPADFWLRLEENYRKTLKLVREENKSAI